MCTTSLTSSTFLQEQTSQRRGELQGLCASHYTPDKSKSRRRQTPIEDCGFRTRNISEDELSKTWNESDRSLQRCGESCFSATALKLTLFPSLGRSSASTLLVLGLAICNLKKTSKNSKGGAQYVAEVRLLTQSSLQASAAYLPLTATTEKFAAIQLAPDSGSRRVNDLKVVFRFLTIFQAINKNIHCDCFKAFTKTIHAMNLFLLPPPQSSIYQGSNIKIPF